MLIDSYDWFTAHLDEIYSGGAERSAHRQSVKLQALALAKKLSKRCRVRQAPGRVTRDFVEKLSTLGRV
jgi:hypothetical protein